LQLIIDKENKSYYIKAKQLSDNCELIIGLPDIMQEDSRVLKLLTLKILKVMKEREE